MGIITVSFDSTYQTSEINGKDVVEILDAGFTNQEGACYFNQNGLL